MVAEIAPRSRVENVTLENVIGEKVGAFAAAPFVRFAVRLDVPASAADISAISRVEKVTLEKVTGEKVGTARSVRAENVTLLNVIGENVGAFAAAPFVRFAVRLDVPASAAEIAFGSVSPPK
jgi:hypothetical protein